MYVYIYVCVYRCVYVSVCLYRYVCIHTLIIRRKGVMLNGPFFTAQRTTLIEYLMIVLER